jgi:hypothetical protein
MTKLRETFERADVWLAVIIVLAIAARVTTWWFKAGFHYPDEIFQQLEPAYQLRTGSALMAWEWGRGLRSWFMPYYYAGVLEVLHWFGISGYSALRAINLHNALWTVTMVPAGFRIGRALMHDDESRRDFAGLIVALLMALLPTLNYFAPHALMGTSSMLFLVWGFVYWAEDRANDEADFRTILLMGFFFGLSGVIRFTTGMFMLLPIFDVLWRRRQQGLGGLFLGALPWLLLVGAIDWATWGRPFHSMIEHFEYNYIEEGASHHGVAPWDHYLTVSLWERATWGLVALTLLVLAGIKRTWLVLGSIALTVGLLSTVPHKEERFLMYMWPLFGVCAGVGAAQLSAWARDREWPRTASAGVVAVLVCVLLGANLVGTQKLHWRELAGEIFAQSWAGDQDNCFGLLTRAGKHHNAGYLVFDRQVPMVNSRAQKIGATPFTHVTLKEGDGQIRRAKRLDWKPVHETEQDITVWQSPDADLE